MKIKNIFVNIAEKIYFRREIKKNKKRLKNLDFDKKLPEDFYKKLKHKFNGIIPIKKNSVNYLSYCYYYSVIGEDCIGCLPDHYFFGRVFEQISDMNFCKAFDNKNYYSLLYRDFVLPVEVGRVINGVCFDEKYNKISYRQLKNLLSKDKRYILKPAMSRSGGDRIITMYGLESDKLDKYFDENKDFVIQEFIKQHEEMKKFSKNSVNSFRTYSLFHEGETVIICSTLRFGRGETEVDNVCRGGAFVPINLDTMRFENYAVDKDGIKSFDANGYDFANKEVYFLGKIIEKIKILHPLVSRSKMVAWDFTVRDDGEPIFIEHNLGLIGVNLLQISSKGKPFGKYTDEFYRKLFKN